MGRGGGGGCCSALRARLFPNMSLLHSSTTWSLSNTTLTRLSAYVCLSNATLPPLQHIPFPLKYDLSILSHTIVSHPNTTLPRSNDRSQPKLILSNQILSHLDITLIHTSNIPLRWYSILSHNPSPLKRNLSHSTTLCHSSKRFAI